MALAFNTVEGKQHYSPVKSNTKDDGTMNGAVEVSIKSSECSTDGHDSKNIWSYNNKTRKWMWRINYLMIFIALTLAILYALIHAILLAVRSEKRSPDILSAVLPDPCPDGWVGYRKKCYYFSLTEGNWTVGNIHCSSHNASLAVVDSQKEKNFLFRYKSPPDHWIGLQKDSGQPWRWVNGRIFTGKLFKLRTEEGRRCAYLNHNTVGSSSCTREEPWICSKEMAKDITCIAKAKP